VPGVLEAQHAAACAPAGDVAMDISGKRPGRPVSKEATCVHRNGVVCPSRGRLHVHTRQPDSGSGDTETSGRLPSRLTLTALTEVSKPTELARQ
jgi:hypothetical protein